MAGRCSDRRNLALMNNHCLLQLAVHRRWHCRQRRRLAADMAAAGSRSVADRGWRFACSYGCGLP